MTMSDNTATNGPSPTTADFGYRQVGRAEKAGLVRAVFDSVAPRYDLMNDLMSLGIHRVWKRIFVGDLDPRPRDRLLDLAGGTGDIGFGWLRAGGGPVLLLDINEPMLTVARQRAESDGLIGDVSLLVADAEMLPLPNGSMDRVSIAFGLRNCTDKKAVLAEVRRVLKPGGRFLCLEFSKLQAAALKAFYDTWSFRVLPRMGGLVAGDSASYRYLAESVRTFPDQETLTSMIQEAGLARVKVRNLSGGIAAIHSGWRL